MGLNSVCCVSAPAPHCPGHGETSRRAGCRRSARFQTEGTATIVAAANATTIRIGAHLGRRELILGFPLFASAVVYAPPHLHALRLRFLAAPASPTVQAVYEAHQGALDHTRVVLGKQLGDPAVLFVLDAPGRLPGFSTACPVEFRAHILPRFDGPDSRPGLYT